MCYGGSRLGKALGTEKGIIDEMNRRNSRAIGCRLMRSGQAMVEFALTAVTFFLLLFGIINFGRVTYAYSFVAYASHNATRWASVRGAQSPSPAAASDVKNYVTSMLTGLQPSNLVVNTTWNPDNQPGSSVQVQVTYNFPLSVPGLQPVTLPLSSTSKFVISD